MIEGHRIERKVKVNVFLNMLKNYSRNQIECTDHTFFRLSEKQRKIFTCENIKDYLLNETPILVGIQYNTCYSVFYKYENKRFIRLIVDITLSKMGVVTFYIIEENQVPKIK